MEQTPGPEGPRSGAPPCPQFKTACGALANGLFGSSISNNASVNWFRAVILLVKFVLKASENVTWGTRWPTGVGVPPVQESMMSPAPSVRPSTRTMGGMLTLLLQVNGGATWAETRPIVRINRKKHPASFIRRGRYYHEDRRMVRPNHTVIVPGQIRVYLRPSAVIEIPDASPKRPSRTRRLCRLTRKSWTPPCRPSDRLRAIQTRTALRRTRLCRHS